MENFIVSARKYRPDTFKSVVGQDSITATLKNAIKNDQLGHAYLFSGPRGVGKTTCARIFAKTINCSKLSDSVEACNECESCISFNENRAYNIHELDAASNNSVDDIRSLTEQVRIPPQVGKYSLYIIDEVHMLSPQAFNAFLKTLEEPPRHAIFILATTEKHKIIPTILSRCQIFDFNRIKTGDAVAYLKHIAKEEKISAEEEALHVIAQKSEGAMRDALSIFDQVVVFSGSNITYASVIENLNILDIEYYFGLTDAFMKNDVSSVLLTFNEILEKGFDARNFINGLASHLRNLMVCKDPETAELLDIGKTLTEKYLAQSNEVPLEFIYPALEICNEADVQFRTSRNQRLTIELALVKLANLTQVQKKKLAQPEKEKAALQKPGTPDRKSADTGKEQKTAPEEKDNEPDNDANGKYVHTKSISIKDSLKSSGEKKEAAESSVEDEKTSSEDVTEKKAELTQDTLTKAWNDYAASIQKDHPRIFNTLKHSQPRLDSKGIIHVSLSSQAQRDNFINRIKPGIIKYLQEKTGAGDFQIASTVISNGESAKKVYTDEDKLNYLIEKNPLMNRFKDSFKLDFDD